MNTSYDLNGLTGINGNQAAQASRSAQALNTDIGLFEQQVETLLQELKTQSAAASGRQTASQAQDSRDAWSHEDAVSLGGASTIDSDNAGASSPQPMIAQNFTSAGQKPNTVQILEQVAEVLLHALKNRDGVQDTDEGAFDSHATKANVASAALSGVSQAQPVSSPTRNIAGTGKMGALDDPDQESASTTQQPIATSNGGTTSVNGAKTGGDTVSIQVINNTDKNEKVALTNSQNQTFASVDLKPGERETFLLDPDDPDTKSARLQTTNPDGSLRQDAKLTEFNLQPGHTAINVSNNNFAGVTGTDGHAIDSEQMKINDGQGKVVGDGAANGSYRNSVDDANAMIMGDDQSKNYSVTIS